MEVRGRAHDAASFEVVPTEEKLGYSMALFRRPAEPFDGLIVVLDALTLFQVNPAEFELRLPVS